MHTSVIKNKTVLTWSQGNPGALNFLMLLLYATDMQKVVITAKLERCSTIRGFQLYILFKDLCGGDMVNVAELCINCPNAVLIDACSRQDGSGKELIRKYLKES